MSLDHHRVTPSPASTTAPTGPLVEFESAGRLLVLGTGPRATAAAARLAERLDCCLLIAGPTEVPAGVEGYRRPPAKLNIGGHLGAFTARFEGDLESPDLGALAFPERPGFDLVLDLDEEPALDLEWGPPGYFRPRDDAELEATLAELPRLTGRLTKPRFFELDSSICAHGLPGTEGCRRCIDTCPVGAIDSVAGRIEVDPNLCQGAGPCSATCPTGALSYRSPSRTDTLAELTQLLAAPEPEGSEPGPLLVLHEPASRGGVPGQPELGSLALEVPAIGSLGLETWLSALALGAGAVRLAAPRDLAPRIAATLDEQLVYARAILTGMGLSPDLVAWLEPESGQELGAEPTEAQDSVEPDTTGARLHRVADVELSARSKRGILYAALDVLAEAAANAGASTTPAAPFVVPSGAPFGTLNVKPEACTTCLACAFVCPTKALTGGGTVPSLNFVEAACVQCGLCVAACPEEAIAREPRLLLHPTERVTSRVLHKDEPFPCIVCGTPFASAGTVRAVIAKLADHPMFAESGTDILQTCDPCRLAPGALER